MTEHHDYLLTLAEVAAAFVGFSMLVSAIGSNSHQHDLRRSFLYDVAQIGFIVIGGSLTPYALASSALPAEWVWRFSSLLLFVVWIVSASLAYRRLRRVAGARGLESVLGPVLRRVNPLVVIAGNVLLFWNVVLPGPHSDARYIGSLLMLLLIATYIFLRAGYAASGD